jgi:hypothetical protein
MKPKTEKGTYVYALVSAPRRPAVARRPRGLPGASRVRLVEVDSGSGPRSREWLVVADVPLDRYGADAINARLGNLDWVSRVAVAHEAVVESFGRAPAILPMKLFTIFTSDERARARFERGQRPHVRAAIRKVTNQEEWGVRVVLNPRPVRESRASSRAASATSGTGYLTRKKRQRDFASELAGHARKVVQGLYKEIADVATEAHRREIANLPSGGGSLLLDAVALVPRARGKRFRAWLEREARRLASDGYAVSLSGPWPPYSFVS